MLSVLVSVLKLLFSPLPEVSTWSFGVIGDTQAGNPWVMVKAMKAMKSRGMKLGLHLGDLYYCGSSGVWKWKQRILKTAGMPWLVTLGNHERWPCGKNGWPTWSVTRRKWARFWFKDVSTMRSWKRRGWLFVSLDLGDAIGPKGHAARLGALLKGHRGPVILFGHRALPAPAGLRSKSIRGPHGTRWQYAEFWPAKHEGANRALWRVIARYRKKIKAYFHGHHHAYVPYQVGGLKAWCSGGGGGQLQSKWRSRGYFHWLEVKVSKTRILSVKVRKVR
jgi:hypothetical protein